MSEKLNFFLWFVLNYSSKSWKNKINYSKCLYGVLPSLGLSDLSSWLYYSSRFRLLLWNSILIYSSKYSKIMLWMIIFYDETKPFIIVQEREWWKSNSNLCPNRNQFFLVSQHVKTKKNSRFVSVHLFLSRICCLNLSSWQSSYVCQLVTTARSLREYKVSLALLWCTHTHTHTHTYTYIYIYIYIYNWNTKKTGESS